MGPHAATVAHSGLPSKPVLSRRLLTKTGWLRAIGNLVLSS